MTLAGKARVIGDYADIGAYEVDPECLSDNHLWDFNHDGKIDLSEFSGLSRFWLAHDPNDPALSDPNLPLYWVYNDPNNPGYVSQAQIALWYPDGHLFNLLAEDESEFAIDLADLLAFVEQTPWCWTACWLDLEDMQMQQMLSGGEEMLMMGGFEQMVIPSEGLQAEVEESIETQISELQKSLILLARIWLEEPDIQQSIDANAWQEFILSIYQEFLDLQAEIVQIE